jgi:enamine deaminase RidA (YjgF/YER057c/UK114 family)
VSLVQFQTTQHLGDEVIPNDVTRITIYVVNYQRDYHLPIIEEARVRLFGAHKAADVVLGVAALSPDYLIEVDAIAVVDGREANGAHIDSRLSEAGAK